MTTTEGERLKEEGMAAAMRAAPASWKEEAEYFVRGLRKGTQITSEDIVAAVGLPRDVTVQRNNNAVGGFMSGLAKRGYLVNTGSYAKSPRASSHATLLTVWERTDF